MPNLTLIANRQESEMLKAFLDSVAAIKNDVKINQLTLLIERGNIDGAIKLLGLDPSAFEGMDEALRQAYRTGGFTGAVQIGGIPTDDGEIPFRFNMRSPAAEEWLRRESSRLIVEMAEGQAELVREVLTVELENGVNPRQAALSLVGRMDNTGKRTGGMIGLTTQQAGWVASARDELENLDAHYFTRSLRDKRLDSVVRSAIESGEPLTEKQINRAITRLQGRTLKYRGDVIARTESIKALSASQDESINQAIIKGEVDNEDVDGEWDSTGNDGHTRDSHLMMEGQKRKHGKPFDFPFGGQANFPRDDSLGAPASEIIQCRCRKNTTIDFIGQLKRVEGFR